MTRYTLTVIDTSGIQDYVFSANNLKQNLGASYLVKCATSNWVVEELPSPHNVLDIDDVEKPFDENARIEDGCLKAEVIYSGGGNALVLFAGQEEAIAFVKHLSRRVLLKAPGLNVIYSHVAFDWQKEALGGLEGVVKKAMNVLAQRKKEQLTPMPQLGLGVSAACAFTDLPAVEEIYDDQTNILISAETRAKLNSEEKAHGRLSKLVEWNGYNIPKDFDDFGRTRGESSYLAVIHIDGNGMGSRIQSLRNKSPKPEQNRAYINDMRAFSLSIYRAAMKSLNETVGFLVNAVKPDGKDKYIGQIKLNGDKLPFRPIVYGGDDVTFVSDGRLGLTLTAYYLKQLASKTLADEKPLYARAGIAVVKTHYPFARAYALAEELCRSAKMYIKERQKPPYYEESLTAVDWHFAVGGLIRDLEEIREREYTVAEGKLFMRPVRLTDPEKDWRSWDTFSLIVREFSSSKWAERRNKIKALRDALRAGPNDVRHFLKLYGVTTLPPIDGMKDMAEQGWQGGWCGYFDAIEVMDFFVPLEGGKS